MSHAASVTPAFPVRRGRAARVSLWALQIALAALFLMAGASKLAGARAMVQLFDAVGLGQWFRYATGLIETGAALALLVPRLAVYGAALLVPTMIGAILTQLFIAHQSPVPPAILLIGAAAVLYARRNELAWIREL